MTVDVVGLEVEQHGDARPKRLYVLELEGGELAHDPRVLGNRADEARERPADVPRHFGGNARRGEDGAEQRGRRRLPVRAGDPENGVLEQAGAQLDLGDDRDTALPRRCYDRRVRRHARALDEEVDAVHELDAVAAQDDADACCLEPGRIDLLGAIVGDHLHTSVAQHLCRRPPRAREADDEHPAGKNGLHGRSIARRRRSTDAARSSLR